jgi:hypothetical protein
LALYIRLTTFGLSHLLTSESNKEFGINKEWEKYNKSLQRTC